MSSAIPMAGLVSAAAIDSVAVPNPFPGKSIIAVHWLLVCINDNNGYVAGEEVPINLIYGSQGNLKEYQDSSTLTLWRSSAFHICPKNSSAALYPTGANWMLKYRVIAEQ